MDVRVRIVHIMCIIRVRRLVKLDLSGCRRSPVASGFTVQLVCPVSRSCVLLACVAFPFKMRRALTGNLVMLYTYHKPHRLKLWGKCRRFMVSLTNSFIVNRHQTSLLCRVIRGCHCPWGSILWGSRNCSMHKSDIFGSDESDVIFVFLKFSYIKIIIIFHVVRLLVIWMKSWFVRVPTHTHVAFMLRLIFTASLTCYTSVVVIIYRSNVLILSVPK